MNYMKAKHLLTKKELNKEKKNLHLNNKKYKDTSSFQNNNLVFEKKTVRKGKHFSDNVKRQSRQRSKKVINKCTSINSGNRCCRKTRKEKSLKHSFLKTLIRTLAIIGMLFFVGMLIFYGIKIFEWYKEKQALIAEQNKITSLVNIVDESSDENDVVGSVELDEDNPYWDFIKMNLLNVDFSELIKANSDTVAWLKINGTNINYPVVQGADNHYYLTHSFYKNFNNAGWIFMDYRNDSKLRDQNTVIYGHNREDEIIFGTLDNILDKSWQSNTNNYLVYLSTKTENTMWQVFSVYHIEATTDYIQTSFSTDEKYENFLNTIKNRSIYNFGTTVTTDDKVLTVSTCLNRNNERIVLHAKLIKAAPK